MVCIYNPDPETLALLRKYEGILGSEEAAYYVVSQNNGFGLDKTPTGEDSILFQQLLQTYGEREAIIKKASIYSSTFLKKYGDWTQDEVIDPTIMQNGEPSFWFLQNSNNPELEKLMNNLFLLDNPQNEEAKELSEVRPVDKNADYAIEQMLKLSLNDYIISELDQYKKEHPNATSKEIESFKLEKQRIWYDTKVRSIMNEQTKSMAAAFGLEYVQLPNGQVQLRSNVSNVDGSIRNLRIKFVESLTNDPLEDELLQLDGKKLRDFYSEKIEGSKNYIADGVVTGRRHDRMISANTLIYLSLNNASAATVSRTLAYHYITMMFDSELIQTALKSLDDTGTRSSLYLVNKLVDAITQPMRVDKTGRSLLDKMYASEFSKEDFDKVQFFNDFWTQFDELHDQIINKGVHEKEARDKILSVVAAAIHLNEMDYLNGFGPSYYVLSSYYDEKSVALSSTDHYTIKYKPDILQAKHKLDSELQFFDTLRKAYENKITRMKKQNEAITKQTVLVKTLLNLQDMSKRDLEKFVEREETVIQLLQLAEDEISNAHQGLIDLKNNKQATILEKAKFIQYAYNETISFYDILIGKLLDPLFTDQNTKYANLKDRRNAILATLRVLQNQYTDLLLENTEAYVDAYINEYMKDGLVTKEDKITAKANYKKWLINQANHGDVAVYEPWITMNHASRSPIVRLALDIIQRANRQRERQVHAKAVELAQALSRCTRLMVKKGNGLVIGSTFIPGLNFQTLFMEHDADGVPTGMFVRKRKYGEFYKLRNAKILQLKNELNEKIRNATGILTYEIETDKNGEPIFPESEFFDEYWRWYNKQLNAFDCTYGNKRFVQEYYDLRFDTLSRKTIEMQNDIQDRINTILNPVKEDGIPHVERLALEDRKTLYYLKKEQDALQNQYYPDGTKKQGDELKAALEIKAFNRAVRDKIIYDRKVIQDENGDDVDLFEYILDKIPDQDKDTFKKYMSTREINPKWWDMFNDLQKQYREQFGGIFDDIFEQIDELGRERLDIVNTQKDRGYRQPNLTKLSDPAWIRIKQIDEEITALYQPILEWLSNHQDNVPSASKLIAQFKEVNAVLSNGQINPQMSQYDKFIRDAIELDTQESSRTGIPTRRHYLEAIDKYSVQVVYTDRYGNTSMKNQPLSAFFYISPKDVIESIANRYGIDDTFEPIVDKPGPEFNIAVKPDDPRYAERGIDSWVNPDYDENEDAFIQPKALNDQYSVLEKHPELMQLYKLLVATMQEANENVPSSFSQDKFKLPQRRSDSSLGIIGRGFENGIMDIPKGLANALRYVFASKFQVNETDDEVNDDFTTMPDGTRLNTIPLRYIQMLEKPEYISRDIVGSVIAYYNMALNYRAKSEVEPLINQLLMQVGQDQTTTISTSSQSNRDNDVKTIQGQKTNQYAKLKNVVDSQLYEQDHIFGRRGGKKLTRGEKAAIKTAKQLRKIGVSGGLSRNLFSQSTAFLDALTENAVFSTSGDAFNQVDFIYALTQLGYNSPKALHNIGKTLAVGKVPAMMQRFGVSKAPFRAFQDTHQTHLRRGARTVLSGMVGFRLADYTINSITMVAMANNMRYCAKYNTFLSKNDFIGRLMHDGYSKRKAEWEYGGATTLFNAYEEVDNSVQLKREFLDKMSPEAVRNLEDEFTTALKTWVPKFNGAVAEEDKAIIQQNIYGSFVTALRTYLINKAQTNFVTGDDFIDDEHSIENIKALKARRKNLIKSKSGIKKPSKFDKRLRELQEQLSKYEDELYNLSSDNVSTFSTLKTMMSPAALNLAIFGGATAFSSYVLSTLTTTGAIISGILGGAATLASTINVYRNTNKVINAKHNVFYTRLQQLSQKISSLRQQIEDLINQENISEIEKQIYELDKEIIRLSTERERKKGIYDMARHVVAHGHMRCFFNAWNALYRKFSWMCKCMFRPNYRNMEFKPSFKLSPQQRRGFVRISVSLFTIFQLWLNASFLLSAYRENDMSNFIPGKAPIIGDYIKSAAEKDLQVYNQTLEEGIKELTQNDVWTSAWEYIHDSSTEGVLSHVPLVNHYAESYSDNMLGYKKRLKTSTGEVTRKKIDQVENLVNLTKSAMALQGVRWYTEQLAPYDIQTVNDLFSSVSAPININFKEQDAIIQFGQGLVEGTNQNLVQRGSWAVYFPRWEYITSNALAPIGVPQGWKSLNENSQQSALQFRLSLGTNKIVFPSPQKDSTKKKNSSKSKSKKKKSFTKRGGRSHKK